MKYSISLSSGQVIHSSDVDFIIVLEESDRICFYFSDGMFDDYPLSEIVEVRLYA